MNIAERLISVVAPHTCLGCAQEGPVLCEGCRLTLVATLPSRCYMCHRATRQSSVCRACKRKSSLTHVWIYTSFDDVAKELVYKLKFGRANAAAVVIAACINDVLPMLDQKIVVTFTPTANTRVRSRGYDQARLIAKELSSRRGWLYAPLLIRIGLSRQVGSSRKQRFEQLEGAFAPRNPKFIKGASILLIDDVLTTGATLESAAKTLKQAGARTVDAAVFAQSAPSGSP